MKILVISNLYPPHGIGGYEERCQYTVDTLRARGHDVCVLTSNHQVADRDASGEHQVIRQLQVHGFYGHPWLPIHKLYRLEQNNQQVLKSTLEHFQPDLVHVWNMGGISKSLLHTLENGPRPLLYDISDHWMARSLKADVWLSWWNQPGSWARKCFRNLAKLSGLKARLSKQVPTAPVSDLKFKQIYFCSHFMRDLSARSGYPVSHAAIIYCGVKTEAFERKLTFTAPRRFLWVGRLAEDKDPLTTIQGFIAARQQSSLPLQLDLYGRGGPAYQSELEQVIQTAGLSDAIRISSVSHEAMRSLYAQYDAYIFSSNWGEPFALTPLEAMASQVPVIMCPDGGDAELLRDGDNAIGFEAGNANSLAEGIRRLLELPDAGKAMSERALKQVEAEFSLEVMCNHIEEQVIQAAKN